MAHFILNIPRRHTSAVSSLAEASRVYSKLRDEADEGASTWPEGRLRQSGEVVARISYNGKIWPKGEWTPGAEPIFDPAKGESK